MLIGLLVIYSSWSLIRQSVAVLMEGAPGHIDVDAVRSALLSVPNVTQVHDLHVWTITSGFVALSAHLTCGDRQHHESILKDAIAVLGTQFGIDHTTIQIDRDATCDVADHVHA